MKASSRKHRSRNDRGDSLMDHPTQRVFSIMIYISMYNVAVKECVGMPREACVHCFTL